MVYFLLRQWPLQPQAALAGPLLFGLHPVQTEAVNFISSRSESLAALFYLIAFYSHLRRGLQLDPSIAKRYPGKGTST